MKSNYFYDVILPVCVVIIIMVLTVTLILVTKNSSELRSFIAEKYNFTEEECVEHNVVPYLTEECYGEIRKNPYLSCSLCSLYCHQIKTGENCTLIERQPNESITLDEFWLVTRPSYYDYQVTKGNCTLKITNGTELIIHNVQPDCIIDLYLESRINITEKVCTPIYGRGSCATAKELQEAKELIK